MRFKNLLSTVVVVIVTTGTGWPAEGSPDGDSASRPASGRAALSPKARRDADKLLHKLTRAGQARVRAQAALALASFPDDPLVVDRLVGALSDSHVMVRSSAARALSKLAPLEKFFDLCEAGKVETEPFARTWIQKAAARAAGLAPKILVKVENLECVSCNPGPDAGQKLRSSFLQKLFEYEGYSVGISLDFSDDGGKARKSDVELSIEGDLVTTGTRTLASATLDVKAVAPGGFVVWAARLEAVDVPQGKAPEVNDPFVDEYTIREEGEDARLVATGELAFKAARRLNVELKGFE